jgi:hypothetical protein
MSNIFGCNCIDCYDNDNLNHRCLLNEVTLDSTGTCENINICDEYECDACERFSLCLKKKKFDSECENCKSEEESEEVIGGGIITLILYCDNVNCDFNDDNRCTLGKGIYLDENGTCTAAQYLEDEGIVSSDEGEDWVDSI